MAALRLASLAAVVAACCSFRTRHTRDGPSPYATMTMNSTAPSSVSELYVNVGNQQQYQVYWPTSKQSSCTAVMFAVGTSMSVSGYAEFGTRMAAKGYIFIVVDPEPGSMTKLNKDRLQTAFLAGKQQWSGWTGNACGSIDAWLLGGHSAGGGTAHAVFVDSPSVTDGVFSVDPLARGDLGPNLDLPGLYWGFSQSTCFVSPADSSQAAFLRSPSTKRVLAKVDVKWQSFPPTPKYYHCSISNGCNVACSSFSDTPAEFYEDVIKSIDVFVESLTTDQWGSTRSRLEALQIDTDLEWFVNEDSL